MTVPTRVQPTPSTSPAAPVDPAATLRLEHVCKHFGKVRAVDDLSLEIPAGSFITLLGPSGCGKTTTLSLIAGLDQVDSGRIYLGDRDITNEPPNERGMAMVFQNYALYPHMTVFENIAFSLKLRRRPKAEIRERVRRVAGMLGIDHLLDRSPAQLSGGQQQRVAVGRALVKQPVAFLLDEPFSNLDAALRARMRTEVKHLHLSLGTTSIFVTHDQEEAMVLSDLIAVMRDGKLVQYGSQREIYGKPANVYVASFVGKPQMSLIEGELRRSERSVDFVGADLRLTLDRFEVAPGRRVEGRVIMGVRAENVELDEGDGVRGIVRLLEPIGSDTFVELDVGGTSLTARARPDLDVEIGESVPLRLERSALHFFAAATGDRLNP